MGDTTDEYPWTIVQDTVRSPLPIDDNHIMRGRRIRQIHRIRYTWMVTIRWMVPGPCRFMRNSTDHLR